MWKAIEYWKMASENEMQLSMINLGNLYLKGSFEGVEKVEIDFKEAKKYFEMALVGRNIVLGKDAQVCLDRMKVLESSDVKKEGSKCFLM